jgi:hypothetical protein
MSEGIEIEPSDSAPMNGAEDDMHIHKPHPFHGVREFLSEIGVIVVGVLIALAAERIVEDWQWREKVSIVRQSLVRELANDRARWEVDVAYAHCARSQISALEAWAKAGRVGAPPPMTLSFFWMHSASWKLATTSQALDHFSMDEQLALATLYDGIENRQSDLGRMSDMRDRVTTLIPLANDAQGRRDLREALGALQASIRTLTNNEDYMRRHFDALRVKPDRSDFAADIGSTACGS